LRCSVLMAESHMRMEAPAPRTVESVSVSMTEDTVSAEFVPIDEDARADE
jgi:hypothetical protein